MRPTAPAMAAGVGTTLDAAAVFSAPWLLIPFCLTYAAVGAAASAEFLRAAVGVLGVLWAADLSVQRLYGTPVLTGVFWNGQRRLRMAIASNELPPVVLLLLRWDWLLT